MTTIHVTASREYDVLVQAGLLDDAGAQIARTLGTGARRPSSRVRPWRGCMPRGWRHRSRARAFAL